MRVIVMWEHVTPADAHLLFPPTTSLFRIGDSRAVQFWDDQRALSRVMDNELPFDTLKSVADVDSNMTAVAWDCVALYRAGRRWERRFPVPDWSGRPVVDVVDTLRARLAALAHLAPADTSRSRGVSTAPADTSHAPARR